MSALVENQLLMNEKFDAKFEALEKKFDDKLDTLEKKFDTKFDKMQNTINTMQKDIADLRDDFYTVYDLEKDTRAHLKLTP